MCPLRPTVIVLLAIGTLAAAEPGVDVPPRVAKAEADYVAAIEGLRVEFATEAAEAKQDLIGAIEREMRRAARNGDLELATALQDRIDQLKAIVAEEAPSIDITGVATAVDERQRQAILLGDAQAVAAHLATHAAAIARFELQVQVGVGAAGGEAWHSHPETRHLAEYYRRYITDRGLDFTWDEAMRRDIALRLGVEPEAISTMVLKHRVDGGEWGTQGWRGEQLGRRFHFPLTRGED